MKEEKLREILKEVSQSSSRLLVTDSVCNSNQLEEKPVHSYESEEENPLSDLAAGLEKFEIQQALIRSHSPEKDFKAKEFMPRDSALT